MVFCYSSPNMLRYQAQTCLHTLVIHVHAAKMHTHRFTSTYRHIAHTLSHIHTHTGITIAPCCKGNWKLPKAWLATL